MTNNENQVFNLNDMEKDVIGEVMNISMGSAATALSTILDRKVNITTPRIATEKTDEFEFSYLEPVIGVLIKYVEGIDGTNILLMKEEDLKRILGHLLSMEPEDMTELDEISVSAICEIMNQMMGSAASALASFLGEVVNISPPEILDQKNKESVRNLFSITGDSLVSVKFNINIEGLIESEFISAMDPKLAREIVRMSMGATEMTEEIIEEAPIAAPVQTPQPASPHVQPAVAPAYEYNEPQAAVPKTIEPVSRPQVQAKEYSYKALGGEAFNDINNSENNLDLIMSVPIQITVELGKTRKKIKDIADLTIGNIVELDRQAGDQVDVVANGRLIARGDVVVVDDNYSVRITEIIKIKENQ